MAGKIKIVADSKIPFLKGVLEPYADINYYRGSEINQAILKDADALIVRTRTLCNSLLLDNTKVQFIATATIGFDHIDTEYCDQQKIKWVNAPGCNSTSVMQYIASTLVVMAKEKQLNLAEKTIGIVGVGNVGRKVANLCNTIGMNVLLNDPPRERKEGSDKFVSLETLKASSDIITFHVPLNKNGVDRSYYLADEEFFADFRPGTILINTSRGPVVKTSALKDAIKRKVTSYCVLDVWENEPNPDLELLQQVNIATPHIAGYSADGKANGTAVCVNAVNDYFSLGLRKNWYPPDIPVPQNASSIKIDRYKKNNQDILSDVILHTYNVREDDNLLRSSSGAFEQLRDDYRIRREFTAFTVKLPDSESLLREQLQNLGFKTETKKNV